MSQNIYQLIDLQRVDPPRKSLEVRRIEFVEIYEPFFKGQAKAQAGRRLSRGNPCCRQKCPVRDYIPNWLKLTSEGRISEAAELSHQTNTLLEVYRRVYPQDRLCEDFYALNNEFGAVTTGSIERYVNNKAFEMGQCPDISGVGQTGKKVMIIGADPTDLACAGVLTRNGIKAIVFDRHPKIGGLLTFGIPTFKSEGEVMTRRHEIFTSMGIEFKLSIEMGRDMRLDDLLSGYGTVFLSVGTYQSMRGGLENGGADGAHAALPSFIANTKQLVDFGEARDEPFASTEDKRVVVLDSGDTTMDCVRTSVRQGAKHVTCAYRRDEEDMPDSRREVKDARGEGVEFKFNVQPLGIEVNNDDKVGDVKVMRIEMGEPDAKGHHHAEIVTGSEHIAPADMVIMAFGFHSHNMEWLAKHSVELDSQGCIITPEDSGSAFQINNPRIFAGGDIVCGSDSVVTATAEGRKTADGIMNQLEVQAK